MLVLISLILAFVPLTSPPVSMVLEREPSGLWSLEVVPHQGWRMNKAMKPEQALVVKLEGERTISGAEATGWPERPRVRLGRLGEAPRGQVTVMLCSERSCRRVMQTLERVEVVR